MRTQAENRSTADRDGDLAAPRKATAPPPLGALQRSAGNAAVTRAVQRARQEDGTEGGQDQESGPAQPRTSVADAVGSPGAPLEPRILRRAESAYGMDFGHVRVHSGPVAQRSAEELGARAYTSGPHIVLGGNGVTDEVMYEEVDHVRQQALGPVPGTVNGRGEKVSHPDDPFERSAGSNGRKLARGAAPDLALPGSSAPPADAVQRSPEEDESVQRSPDEGVLVQRVPGDGPTTEATAASETAPAAEPSPPASPAITPATPVAALPATARLARLIVGGTAEIRNKQVRSVLDRRERNGPKFTAEELQMIRTAEAEDPGWLRTVGLCTHLEAEDYIKKDDFHSWLAQPKGKRLLIATLRWQQHAEGKGKGPAGAGPRPDYQLGRHHAMRDKSSPEAEREQLTGERNEQIFRTFVATLLPPGISDEVPDAAEHRKRVERGTEILTKIFLILKEGLQVFNPKTGLHEDFKDDVAHALAYGGRVNIRIPQLADGQHGYELPRWLHITRENPRFYEPNAKPEAPVYKRTYATHHMDIGDNKPGQPGRFVEKGGLGATAQNLIDPHSHLYGMGVGIGGTGNTGYHGGTILPDESHGHLFMGYKPPTGKRDGALQVGIETAGPGGRTPEGYEHNWKSSEKTANPFSNFGGHKDDKIGGDAPLSASQRYVDLRQFGDWLKKLKDLEADWKSELAKATTDEERAALYRDLIGKRSGS
ncbi:DUF4157 domain-containing protein [Streptomyces sp. NPDC059224]|uniref:eCIS core domain-containing protein n=1 Tax=Streptomyces sp. NPDC059224 TaxID=3346775 RepID=UPI0036844B8C